MNLSPPTPFREKKAERRLIGMRCRLGIGVVIWILSVHCAAIAFPSVLEAERAERDKKAVIVPHPNVSGGAFVGAKTGPTLSFKINSFKTNQIRSILGFWCNKVRF